MPKEMLPVVDRPLIQHVVEEAAKAGIKQIFLVTRSGKSALEDHFDCQPELESLLADKGKDDLLDAVQQTCPEGVTICAVRQPQAGGLGQAVLCAAPYIEPGEAFAVLLPDVLVKPHMTDRGKVSGQGTHPDLVKQPDLNAMISRYRDSQAAQIMVAEVPLEQVNHYGIVDCQSADPLPGESVTLKGIIEKPAPDEAPGQLSVVGRYILPQQIMPLLAAMPADGGGEVQLTDAIAGLLGCPEGVEAYHMTERSFDCGSVKGWLRANACLGAEQGLLEF